MDEKLQKMYSKLLLTIVRMFGMPEMVIVDPGTEFRTHFADMCSSYGCLILPTDPRCPWQNGRTERAGKEWKFQFKLASRHETPSNASDAAEHI